MSERTTAQNAFILFRRFTLFLIAIAFAGSCSLLLFMKSLQNTIGYEFTQQQITPAAKATFWNIIFITIICTVIDTARNYFFVERPIRMIAGKAEKVIHGDLTVRIPRINGSVVSEGYNIIIEIFNHMIEELSGMETLRTDFIANVSHELKTPLAVMQNYGTILQQPNLSEEKRVEYAKGITDASGNLANMVTNILKLNKLENQNIYPNTHVYNLSEQVAECLLGYEDVWEKKNIEVETEIDDSIYVDADPELLTLVWNNLFSNAFKFTDEGGTVGLAVKKEEDKAVVKIRDSGCGISEDVGQHIFEKFYQGDTSHATKGNGLGLALVKRVIDITSAEISVDSKVGAGSTFTVKLKRVEDEQMEGNS